MLVMGNILEVADQNNVNILQQDSPYYEAYNKIISDNFTPNTAISDIRQYGDGKQPTLNNLKVITSDFGTPVSPLNAGDITEYWIPTSNIPSGLYGRAGNDEEELFIYSNYGAFEVQLNELNQYITGSLTPPLILINNISSSLLAGERWFVTFYTASGLPNPLDKTSLQPMSLINYSFPPQFRQKGTDAQILLAARGVAEITSVRYLTGSGDGKLTYTPQSAFGEPYFGPNERGLISIEVDCQFPQERNNCEILYKRFEELMIIDSGIEFPIQLKHWMVTINPTDKFTIMNYFRIEGIKKIVEENKSKLIGKTTYIKPEVQYKKKGKYPNLHIHFFQLSEDDGIEIYDIKE
jgi:hypothetical protein